MDKMKQLEQLAEELDVKVLGKKEEIALERAYKKYPIYVKPRLDEIYEWAKQGLSNEQMARRLGIHRTSLEKYQKIFPALDEAMMTGKDVADIQVVNALHKMATGYVTEEEELKITRNGDIVRADKTVHHQPAVGAAKLWLYNRRPKEWQDKQEIDHNHNIKRVEFVGEDDLED